MRLALGWGAVAHSGVGHGELCLHLALGHDLPLYPRVGRRWVLLSSLLIVGAGGTGAALAPDFTTYCVCRTLSGIGLAGFLINYIGLSKHLGVAILAQSWGGGMGWAGLDWAGGCPPRGTDAWPGAGVRRAGACPSYGSQSRPDPVTTGWSGSLFAPLSGRCPGGTGWKESQFGSIAVALAGVGEAGPGTHPLYGP